jgi:hypothetical protein
LILWTVKREHPHPNTKSKQALKKVSLIPFCQFERRRLNNSSQDGKIRLINLINSMGGIKSRQFLGFRFFNK